LVLETWGLGLTNALIYPALKYRLFSEHRKCSIIVTGQNIASLKELRRSSIIIFLLGNINEMSFISFFLFTTMQVTGVSSLQTRTRKNIASLKELRRSSIIIFLLGNINEMSFISLFLFTTMQVTGCPRYKRGR